MNKDYEVLLVKDSENNEIDDNNEIDENAVLCSKIYFYNQIKDSKDYRSLIINDNDLSQKSNEFFIIYKKDKSDTKEIKQKINKLYKQALKIDTKTDNWKIEEQKIKNNLAELLNLNKKGMWCGIF